MFSHRYQHVTRASEVTRQCCTTGVGTFVIFCREPYPAFCLISRLSPLHRTRHPETPADEEGVVSSCRCGSMCVIHNPPRLASLYPRFQLPPAFKMWCIDNTGTGLRDRCQNTWTGFIRRVLFNHQTTCLLFVVCSLVLPPNHAHVISTTFHNTLRCHIALASKEKATAHTCVCSWFPRHAWLVAEEGVTIDKLSEDWRGRVGVLLPCQMSGHPGPRLVYYTTRSYYPSNVRMSDEGYSLQSNSGRWWQPWYPSPPLLPHPTVPSTRDVTWRSRGIRPRGGQGKPGVPVTDRVARSRQLSTNKLHATVLPLGFVPLLCFRFHFMTFKDPLLCSPHRVAK